MAEQSSQKLTCHTYALLGVLPGYFLGLLAKDETVSALHAAPPPHLNTFLSFILYCITSPL